MDGSVPTGAFTGGGSLIESNGMLYGTTGFGGAYAGGERWGGTAFRISTTGTSYRVLHSFGKGNDGLLPISSVIDVNGTLYGTTLAGGLNSGGTIFRVSANGAKYRVVYNFVGSTGSEPAAGLIYKKGTLYGTTSGGGAYGGGTVFSMTTNGTKVRVLHTFGKGADGAVPLSGLTLVQGMLYGTTACGGAYANNCNGFANGDEGGTAYQLSLSGAHYRVLHNFGNAGDGVFPIGNLVYLGGMFYGSTNGDSTTSAKIFSMSATGAEHIIYSWAGAAANGLAGSNGTLYGTTPGNGSYNNGGTIFSVLTTGTNYVTLHSFGNGTDGSQPYAGVVIVNGVLYGTTDCGGTYGANSCGGQYGRGGTVFMWAP